MSTDAFFNISKEKIDQVISVVLSKLAKKDVERFGSAGMKASLIDARSPTLPHINSETKPPSPHDKCC